MAETAIFSGEGRSPKQSTGRQGNAGPPQRVLSVTGWTGFQSHDELEAKVCVKDRRVDQAYEGRFYDDRDSVAAVQARLSDEVRSWNAECRELKPLRFWPAEEPSVESANGPTGGCAGAIRGYYGDPGWCRIA